MPEVRDQPLLTFAVFAYKQKHFIREAAEGAFSQTYSPLEIILSDDCSNDGTYEAMSRIAAGYKGPHLVRLNRTPRNLGLCGHVNQVAEISKGALIVGSAGDDISLPNRTSLTFEAWESSGRKSTSIWGDSILIDENGIGSVAAAESSAPRPMFHHQSPDPAVFLSKRSPAVYGCSHAFSPVLFSVFGPLSTGNVMEDFQLGFRSALAGAMTHIGGPPLVKYRRHGANLSAGQISGAALDMESFAQVENKRKRVLDQFIALFDALAVDLETAKFNTGLTDVEYRRIKAALAAQIQQTRLRRACLGVSQFEAATAIWQLRRAGGSPRLILGLLPRLLPRSVFSASVILANRLRKLVNASGPAKALR